MTGLGGSVAAGAVSAILYVAALTWPVLSPLAVLLLALPGMYLAILQPPRASIVWLVSAVVVAATLTSSVVALGLVVPFGLTVLVIGRASQRGGTFPQVAAWGIGAWVAAILVTFTVAGDPSVMSDAIRERAAEMLDNAASNESPGPTDAVQSVEQFATLAMALFPALLTVFGAAVVLIDLGILRRLAGVLRETDLTCWRSPDGLVWILIGAGFAGFWAPEPVRTFAINVILVVALIYFLQGLSIVAFYVERAGFPRPLRPLLYFFLLMQYVLTFAVTLVGFVDLWADLRRLRPRPVEPDTE